MVQAVGDFGLCPRARYTALADAGYALRLSVMALARLPERATFLPMHFNLDSLELTQAVVRASYHAGNKRAS